MQKNPKYFNIQKQQSAIEFLTTYSWAIVIILIVIGIFVKYIVLGGTNNKVVQQPGECTVYKPQVAIGSTQPTLKGVCNDAIPDYVASFNPTSGGIATPTIPWWSSDSFSITSWVNANSDAGVYQNQTILFLTGSGGGCTKFLGIYEGKFFGEPFNIGAISSISSANAGNWYFIALTYNYASGVASFYVNGNLQGMSSGSISFPSAQNFGGSYVITAGINLGSNDCAPYGGTWTINGTIANVQLYNTSLSQSDIQALYQEGIGGAPKDLQNLVGWWPLNGNANDYSGNGNNGQINNVAFVSNWQNGYTAP